MPPPAAAAREERRTILCADDYAMTDGISTGIEELIGRGRLSAVSALVTGPHWLQHGRRLARFRDKVALGLHLNLTLGSPLGPVPHCAPDGNLPTVGTLTKWAALGKLDAAELQGEVARQLAHFSNVAGVPPDFLDGHQHVHALPVVRHAVIGALCAQFPRGRVLVRDPADRMPAILARGGATTKAAAVAALARGFAKAVRASGFPTNTGFAGFSSFDTRTPYAAEFERFFLKPGRCHLVMCHPGHVDGELRAIDPVTDRREDELSVIRDAAWLDGVLWRPRRGIGSLWSP